MTSGGLTSVILQLTAEISVAQVTGGELTSLVAMVVSGGLTSRVAAVITEGLTSLGGELTSLVAVVIMQVDTEGTVAKVITGTPTLLAAEVALQASRNSKLPLANAHYNECLLILRVYYLMEM